MRNFSLILLVAGAIACGGPKYIADLPLVWAGVEKSPPPTAAVQNAFANVPIEIGEFKDARTGDRKVVGTYEEDGYKVQTNGDVGAFWAGRQRQMLEAAGARFQTSPLARFDAELLQLDVLEGNMYVGTASVKFTVTRKDGKQPPWSKVYEGKSKRWGRSHSADNFNEALSNALSAATKQLVTDDAFAAALQGEPAPSATPSAAPSSTPAPPASSAPPSKKGAPKGSPAPKGSVSL